jgi:hypothetical protein
MAAVEVQHYLGRARDLLKGMEDLMKVEFYVLEDDFVSYKYSPAILGIHGAISYSDALRTGMGQEKVSSDDHSQAANDLDSLLKSRNFVNRIGIGHLKDLLGKKNTVEYRPVTVRENQVEDIVKHARRFADWAEEAGRNLRIVGW